MRGAFIVQLCKASQGVGGPMEGWVEEVDTGKQSRFHSEKELIRFLRERFSTMQSLSQEEATDGPHHRWSS
jgi:hypothetical protein